VTTPGPPTGLADGGPSDLVPAPTPDAPPDQSAARDRSSTPDAPAARGRAEKTDGAPRLRHVPALDGLRGAAVAGVLLFHSDLLIGGYLGVDLFFVLSGFLITSLLLTERREKGRIELRRFWARRARRLLPALGGLLAGIVVFAAVFADPNQLGQIRADGLATMAYVANWHAIFSNTGYWDLFVAPSPLEHMWSLAIEEQFYVVWPFVAYAVLRPRRPGDGAGVQGPRRLFVVSAVAALASAAAMARLASPATVERVYLGTDTRAASILVGAALACWLAWRGPVRGAVGRVLVEVAGWIGLAVLAVAWCRVDGRTLGLYRGGLFLCALAVAAVIAAAAHPRPGPLASLLAWRPLRALGLISYGLYLWHWPVFLVVDEQRLDLGRWPLFAVRLVVSLALAVTSYLVLERPIRQGRLPAGLSRVTARRSADRAADRSATASGTSSNGPGPRGHGGICPVLAAGRSPAVPPGLGRSTSRGAGPLVAGAVAVVVLLAGLLVATRGATTPEPLADTVTGVRASLDEVPPPADVPPSADGSTTGPARVLFAGDSVAYFLAQEVLAHQGDFGIVAANAALPGCRFTPGRIRTTEGKVVEDTLWPMCDTLWAEALDRVRPDVVFLTVADPGAVDREVERQWTTPCDERFEHYLRDKVTDAVARLGATGAMVVVGTSVRAMPTYANGVDPEHLDCFNETIRSAVAAEPGARLVDVDGFVCPGGTCTDVVDGRPLRLDGLHFVDQGADYVDAWLVPRLVEAARVPPS
jgi:peptidoglycan/LPS O-acetylase OafA/YrhL